MDIQQQTIKFIPFHSDQEQTEKETFEQKKTIRLRDRKEKNSNK